MKNLKYVFYCRDCKIRWIKKTLNLKKMWRCPYCEGAAVDVEQAREKEKHD